MTKPLNGWAIAMWIAAAVYAMAVIVQVLEVDWDASSLATMFIVTNVFEHVVLYAGQLASLGFLIELVDRIQWQSLPPEERDRWVSRRRGVRQLWWTLRRWPHGTSK